MLFNHKDLQVRLKHLYYYFKLVIEKANNVAAVAAQWVLFALALIIFYDVVMRYIFSRPTTWVLEISEYMLVFVTFVGAVQVQRKKSHIKMDYFYGRFPLRLCRYLDIFFNIIISLFFLLILLTSLQMTLIAFHYNSISNSLLEIPLVIPYSIVPFGMLLVLLQSIIDIAESVKAITDANLDEKTGG